MQLVAYGHITSFASRITAVGMVLALLLSKACILLSVQQINIAKFELFVDPNSLFYGGYAWVAFVGHRGQGVWGCHPQLLQLETIQGSIRPKSGKL